MDWGLRQITCGQLSVQILPLKEVVRPSIGWIKTIRKVLGMTSQQLGKRCGISKQRVLRIEQDEVLGVITLATLEKLAKQLDCELVYGLVPKKDFKRTILVQAGKKARERIERVSHTMVLENQGISEKEERQQLELLMKQILDKNIKSLWD
jgi:predicted DNA-binding mobile mystery protein A